MSADKDETILEGLASIGEPDHFSTIYRDFASKMRENGFMRRILPPVQIGSDDLDRSCPTDKPIKIVDKP